jgi:hypothetical protein
MNDTVDKMIVKGTLLFAMKVVTKALQDSDLQDLKVQTIYGQELYHTGKIADVIGSM